MCENMFIISAKAKTALDKIKQARNTLFKVTAIEEKGQNSV